MIPPRTISPRTQVVPRSAWKQKERLGEWDYWATTYFLFPIQGLKINNHLKKKFLLLFFFFFFFRVTPAAYGGSQVRGLIRAVAAGLYHSLRNVRSKPHLQPTPQLTAMLYP